MVLLNFDASVPPPEQTFSLTFGRSRSEVKWVDRQDLTFQQIAERLSTSPVGSKDGPCYTPAVFAQHSRKMEFAQQIDLVVLDADSGHSFEDIKAAVSAKGWRAIVHSTYSHLSTESHIAAEAAEKWMLDNPGAPIGAYMVSKKNYLPAVMHGAQIIDEVKRENNKRDLIIQHSPCPKFRIILTLDEPWRADDYDTQTLANAKWRDRIGALAYALNLSHDQSCVDTSRLFYLPRRRDEAQEFAYAVLDGEDCPLWSLPDAVATSPLFAMGETGAASRPGLQVVDNAHRYVSDDFGTINLTQWIAEYGQRFEVVKALKARSPAVFAPRINALKHHIWCPNAGSHFTNSGDGSGTYCVNASEVSQTDLRDITGFVIQCSHDGCKTAGKDRLDHIEAFLADGSLTIADLTSPAFLTPDLPAVDLSAMVRSSANRILSTQAPPEGSNIHPSLWADLPGVLGLMHKWVIATSPKPQPELTLGAMLAFCASAIGQRVQLQGYGTRPNIYILNVAYSGAGKDRPMSACKAMARAAGLFEQLIGVEEVASDSGIVSSVMKAPRQMMLIDEVSFMLGAATSSKSGAHLTNVVGTLLKLYSSSDEVYKSKSYADSDKVKTVDQPCVSFLGNSTPRGLSDALTNKDITSGLLSRMMLFSAGDRDPRINMPSQEPVPPNIVDWLTAWDRVSPIQNPMHRVGGEQLLEPRVVMVTDEAIEIARNFEGEMHETKLAARANGNDALYVRALENALKFALIRACAVLPAYGDNGPYVDESNLKVDAQTMRWAVDLSRSAIMGMCATTADLAESVYEQQLKQLRQVIHRKGENGITIRELSRTSAGRHSKQVLENLLNSLKLADEVFFVSIPTAGRPREVWVNTLYRKVHGSEEET